MDALSSIAAVAGSGYRLSQAEPQGAEPVLEGRFLVNSMGLALQVHASDALEMENARADILLPPSLTVSLILHGDIQATLDGMPLLLSASGGPSGCLWFHRRPVRLERGIRAGQRVRKVNVSVPLDALEDLCRGVGESEAGSRLGDFLKSRDLTLSDWSPSRQSVRFAEQILADRRGDALGRMTVSICALILVRDALSQLAGSETADEPSTPRDASRAHRVRRYIIAHLAADLRLSGIARHTAMSVSTLQRVFKSCFGVTVFEFIRARRLERARENLCRGSVTVSEAAYRARYSSAANFATAFRHEFGYPPSHCLCTGGASGNGRRP